MNTHPPTPCCNYAGDSSLPYPVFWNPYNCVVQCHNCGHQYEPAKPPSVANEPDLGEWLGPVALAAIEAAASPPEKLRDAIQKSIETAAAERFAKSLIPHDLPLSPPPGYRMIANGEVICDCDLFCNGREWLRTGCSGELMNGGKFAHARPASLADNETPDPEPWMPKPSENLRKDIERAINSRSAENGSDTPDFILANYLIGCLENFDKAVVARDDWYGRGSSPP